MASSAQRLLRGGPPEASTSQSSWSMAPSSRLDGLNALDAFLGAGPSDPTSSLDLWLGTTFGERDFDVGVPEAARTPTRPGFVDPFELAFGGAPPEASASEAFLALPRLPATFTAAPPPELPATVNDQPVPVVVAATTTSGRPARRTATTAEAKRRRLSLLAEADAGGEDDGDEDYAAPPEALSVSGSAAGASSAENAAVSAVAKENTRRARNTEASGLS